MAHRGHDVFRRRVHHGRALHHELFHQRLAARALVALKRRDGAVLTAELAPVRDLARVNVPRLLDGDGVNGVILIHDEDECVGREGLLLPREVQLFLPRHDVVIRLANDQHIRVAFKQVEIGRRGLVEVDKVLHVLAALAEDLRAHGKRQRHGGGRTVQTRHIVAREGDGRSIVRRCFVVHRTGGIEGERQHKAEKHREGAFHKKHVLSELFLPH